MGDMTCISGDGRARRTRGLCGSCYRRFLARLRSGAVTEAEAVAAGEVLPSEGSGAFSRGVGDYFRARRRARGEG